MVVECGACRVVPASRLREPYARAAVGPATTAWLTSPHREAEQARDPAARPLKFEAYSNQITSELGSVMKHHDTPPLPAIAFEALANMAPREEVQEQASFPWFASTMLAYESFEVIRLRLEKILLGGDGEHHEARLMV